MREARRAEGSAGAQWPAAKVKQWPLSDLVPSARNARRHPPEQIEQLAKLIERFGWTMPVLCRENGEIIAGHGRAADAEQQHARRSGLRALLGSGTTLIAAELTGRVCFGVELDPAYVDVAVERWQRFTGREATLEGDERSFDELRAERAVA